MRSRSSAFIVEWGAASPLGPTAEQTGFLLRAGKNNFDRSLFIDCWGERVSMSYLPTLPQNLAGPPRIAQLAQQALAKPLHAVDQAFESERVGFAIAIPERCASVRGELALNEAGHAVAAAFTRSQAGRRSGPVAFFPLGRAAAAVAMQEAMDWLSSGLVDVAMVGGADTYYDWAALAELERQDRLITEDNLDGLIPGEGAAFVAVVGSEHMRHRIRIWARMVSTAYAQEPVPVLAEGIPRAQGITAALQEIFPPGAFPHPIYYWFTDLTNETYGVKEFQVLLSRLGKIFGLNSCLMTPLRELGDVGAATLPLFWTLALESWRHGYAPDLTAACMAGSDYGLRAATLLESV